MIYCKPRGSNVKFGPVDLRTGERGVEVDGATKFDSLEAAVWTADKMAEKNPGYLFQVRKPRRSWPEYIPEGCKP